MIVTQQQQQLTTPLQTLQDSGYGGTDKRPVPRSEDYDGAGDKENSSPNRKVCDFMIMITIMMMMTPNYPCPLSRLVTARVPARRWPASGATPRPPRCRR